MKRLLVTSSFGTSIVAALMSANSMAFEEIGKVQTKLEPMERPEQVVGQKRHYFSNDKGKEGFQELLGIKDDVASWHNADGCTWQEVSDWDFSPSLAWKDCEPFADGTQKVELVKGSIWPLEKGTKFTYSVSGKGSDGNTWATRRTCKVKKEVRVKTIAGEFDTFKLDCRDDWSTRTYYLTPEMNGWVAFKRSHQKPSRRRNLELTKIE